MPNLLIIAQESQELAGLSSGLTRNGFACAVIPHGNGFVQEIAAEFDLSIRLLDGLPLRANPAVSALQHLLQLMLPRSGIDAEPALPRRQVVEAWRSPYFDWSALPEKQAMEPIGIEEGDAETLDAVARFGRVIGGLTQWQQVLDRLAACDATAAAEEQDDEQGCTLFSPQPRNPFPHLTYS